MCGRFARYIENQLLIEMLLAELPDLDAATFHAVEPTYNAAPGQELLAIGRSAPSHAHKFALLRWGLIPRYAHDLKGRHPINARSESVLQSAMFAAAFSRQRCLILASGFYEWRAEPEENPAARRGPKPQATPFYFTVRDRPLIAFAGIYDGARIEGQRYASVCILTTAANATVRPVHERMPVILTAGDFKRWCDPTVDGAGVVDLLRPYPAAEMLATAVGRQVNSARNNNASLIAPAP